MQACVFEDAAVCMSACVYVVHHIEFYINLLYLRTNVAILDITLILISVNQI